MFLGFDNYLNKKFSKIKNLEKRVAINKHNKCEKFKRNGTE